MRASDRDVLIEEDSWKPHLVTSEIRLCCTDQQASHFSSQNHKVGFPGGPVVKNPPANAGDTGSIPGPGRFHMPQGSWAHEPQLLSPGAATREATARSSPAPRLGSSPRSPQLEKAQGRQQK